MPPEAAAAAADHASQFSSWTCPACTLINAPQVGPSPHLHPCSIRTDLAHVNASARQHAWADPSYHGNGNGATAVNISVII